jgi:hypothetical protein
VTLPRVTVAVAGGVGGVGDGCVGGLVSSPHALAHRRTARQSHDGHGGDTRRRTKFMVVINVAAGLI